MRPRASPVSTQAHVPCQALSPSCQFTLPCWAVFFSAKEEDASTSPTLLEHRPHCLPELSENLSYLPPAASPLPVRDPCESTAAWTRDSVLRISSPFALSFHYFKNLSLLGIITIMLAYSRLMLTRSQILFQALYLDSHPQEVDIINAVSPLYR